MSPEEKPTSDMDSDLPVESEADASAAELVPANESALEPVEASYADVAAVQPESVDSVIVESEIVESEFVESQSDSRKVFYPDATNVIAVGGMSPSMYAPPALAHNFENLAAKGGAVGALVLGVWCFAGSFVTNWSIINGLLGLAMGFWGLTSKHKKMAWIGIALCLIGMFLSLVQVSELVNMYLNARDETSFQ
jgi:hypothetical protein